MADIFNDEKRSEIMRKVKSKKNKSTELRLIEIFKQNGITGWKRNYPVKGHPDFVFQKEKVAVFVDGCFWHGHDCRNTRYFTTFRLSRPTSPALLPLIVFGAAFGGFAMYRFDEITQPRFLTAAICAAYSQ